MKIVIFDKKTNKIENIIDAVNIESTVKLLKEKSLITKDKDYKTFENISCHTGLDIRAVKKNGDVMTTKEQIDAKIITLAEDEKFNAEKDSIEKLTEVELCEKYPDRLSATQKIMIDENGAKYLTEKTMKEKLDDNLIAIAEYNEYIIAQRRNAYKSATDDLVIERMIDFLINNDNDIDMSDVESMKASIKADFPKL